MASVILTDALGNAIGAADVLEAHTGEGRLHKAFSVYVFAPDRRELLIQRRSRTKMLWPLVWANTCCSHPRPGETALEAGARRTQEEMGFRCPLREGQSFVYRAVDPAGRGVEHEHVTTLISESRPVVEANRDEVEEWQWAPVTALRREMAEHPERYAPWFHLGLQLVLQME
jgi:isopentenyl-diphosphate delta-isomerase